MSYVSFKIKNVTVLVDAADAPLVESRTWCVSNGYVMSGKQYLHRMLLPLPAGLVVDHINGDRADCRRSNLRPASPAQHRQNRRKSKGKSSAYKGVTFDRQAGKWKAQIGGGGKKNQHLGHYSQELTAALAYDSAARRLFGAYAAVNYPFADGEQWALRP